MKKFWKYFTIVILLLLGLVCVGFAYLFFVPGSTLFGLTYISHNDDYSTKEFALTDINKVVVNSRSFDVKIMETKGAKTRVNVHSSALGFAKKRNSEVKITSDVERGILTVNVTEPHGALFINDSRIEILVPESSELNLAINNNNAQVSIENSAIKLNNLDYTAKNGRFRLKKANILGDLTLDLNNSDFEIYKDSGLNGNNVNLKTSRGTFDAKDTDLGYITVEENVRGVILAKSCTNIIERVNTAGGRIEIGTVQVANIQSSDTNIKIGRLEAGGTLVLTNSGKVDVNLILSNTDIRTNKGNINIGESAASVICESKQGNITINKASLFVTTKNESGNTKVSFNEDVEGFGGSSTARSVLSETNSGEISITGAENVNIKITGRGRADVKMRNVLGVNIFDVGAGGLYIQFGTTSVFDLTCELESSSLNANFVGLTNAITSNEGVAYPLHVNCGSTTNLMSVLANQGNIRIRDDITAEKGY